MKAQTLLVAAMLSGLASSSLLAGDGVEAAEKVARSFLTAIYQNDYDAARQLVVDSDQLESFVGEETLDAETRARVRTEIAQLRIDLAPGYEEASEASSPMGATVRFSLAYRGTPMVVSTIRVEGGWRVDLRWWVAMIRSARGERLSKRHPEVVTRRYLIALLQRDEKVLGRLLPQGYRIGQLYEEGYVPPFEDQYYYLAMEMPLVELEPAELVRLADGSNVPALAQGSKDKVLVGMYWDTELRFRLISDGESYRIEPGDHLTRIGL